MAYKQIDDPNFLEDLYSRKEIYELLYDENRDFRSPGQPDPYENQYLKLHSHQIFAKRFLNSNTPYKRLVLEYAPGTGKTLAAIAIAVSYIEIYKKQYMMAVLQTGTIGDKRRVHLEADKMTPSVYIFGFDATKKAFYKELMRYPEFGFITQSEREDLLKWQRLASSSGLPADKKRYKDQLHLIRKRITNKSKDGFYKFYGYQKFVNMLFLSSETSLVELEKQAITEARRDPIGAKSLETIIHEHVESGKIQINIQLLEQFKGSLLICDEFHNTYNMNMKNNYGVAIQYILDYHGANITAVFPSATPINNSPTEIVEIINYVVPANQKVTKRELFSSNRDLRDGALERITELCRGRVSFMQDSNPKYFPKRTFIGESIEFPATVQKLTSIPYLKFVVCKMSPMHQNTYLEMLRESAGEPSSRSTSDQATETVVDEIETAEAVAPVDRGDSIEYDIETIIDTKKQRRNNRRLVEAHVVAMPEDLDDYDTELTRVPTNGYTIYDMVFPHPDSEEVGLYRSSETRNRLMTSSPEWRAAKKIDVKKFSSSNYTITGDFLLESNIGKYSTKYYRMISDINEICRNSEPKRLLPTQTEVDAYLHGEKLMIYHDRVKMSGVLTIGEILRVNGFIDEFSEPIDRTRCAFCTGTMGNHDTHVKSCGLIEHKYHPARFVMAHSDIDRPTMDASLQKYSASENSHGGSYKILVGSKIIKEGYDMKSVQHLFVLTLPVNISALIQVMGRCVRKGSHADLPLSAREVKIRLFITTLDRGDHRIARDAISPEELRYVEKLNDYMVIQKIEREINRAAVDSPIHRDIIMPRELLNEYFPNRRDITTKTIYETSDTPVSTLGNLYFNVEQPHTYDLKDLNLLTFTAYGYYNEEITMISYIIKRLFVTHPVWTYDDLWNAVRQPPFGVETNPKMFLESSFVVALSKLVDENVKSLVESELQLSRIFDPNDRYLYMGSDRYVVQQVGKWYVAFPIVNGIVIRDADSYLRTPSSDIGVKIDMDRWIHEQKSEHNYSMRKTQFKMKYCGERDIFKFLGDFDAAFYDRLLAEIIVWKVDGTPKVDEQLKVLYEKVVELFDRFRIIVYLEEVILYREIAKKFSGGVVVKVSKDAVKAGLNPRTPVGFLTLKSVRLYDSPNWIETSKSSMNKRTHFVEMDPIIGYFDQGDGDMRFKLRKPVQQLKMETPKDTRMIERGMVCSTKSKNDLLDVAKKLGLETKKMSREDFRIKTLCDIIKSRLLELEMKHRQRNSKYKVFYMWNETQLNLAGWGDTSEGVVL